MDAVTHAEADIANVLIHSTLISLLTQLGYKKIWHCVRSRPYSTRKLCRHPKSPLCNFQGHKITSPPNRHHVTVSPLHHI